MAVKKTEPKPKGEYPAGIAAARARLAAAKAKPKHGDE